MDKPDIITYQSDNGYSGKLKSWVCDGECVYALHIYDRFGDEVLHAARATAKTPEDLKECVDTFPAFLELLNGTEVEDGDSDDI